MPLSPEPLLLEPLLLLELLLLEPAPPELLLLLELLLLDVLLLEPFDSPPSPAPASGIWGLADVHANGRRPKGESHTSDQTRIRGAYPAQSAVQESNRSGVFQREDNVDAIHRVNAEFFKAAVDRHLRRVFALGFGDDPQNALRQVVRDRFIGHKS